LIILLVSSAVFGLKSASELANGVLSFFTSYKYYYVAYYTTMPTYLPKVNYNMTKSWILRKKCRRGKSLNVCYAGNLDVISSLLATNKRSAAEHQKRKNGIKSRRLWLSKSFIVMRYLRGLHHNIVPYSTGSIKNMHYRQFNIY